VPIDKPLLVDELNLSVSTLTSTPFLMAF